MHGRAAPRPRPISTTLLALNDDYIRSVQTSDVSASRRSCATISSARSPTARSSIAQRFLEQTAQPVTISNLEAHDVNVRLMGDFAIVHARTTYTTADGRAGAGRYTDVWARRQGRWLAVSAHVTRSGRGCKPRHYGCQCHLCLVVTATRYP